MFIGKAKFKVAQPYGQMLVLEGALLTFISVIFSVFGNIILQLLSITSLGTRGLLNSHVPFPFFLFSFLCSPLLDNLREELFLFPMALAMGIQNSMCTTWGGAVVRTTHFTGVLTDIGIVTGLFFRYKFRGERRSADCYLFSVSIFFPTRDMCLRLLIFCFLTFVVDSSYHFGICCRRTPGNYCHDSYT